MKAPKRSISEIIKDSVSARNAELDRLYNTKPKNVTSAKIKSTIPTGPQHKEANPDVVPTKVQFTKKHEGKWGVFTQENLGGKMQWRVHSVHNSISETEPHLDNGIDLRVPMYIDTNLHSANIVGHENFL